MFASHKYEKTKRVKSTDEITGLNQIWCWTKSQVQIHHATR